MAEVDVYTDLDEIPEEAFDDPASLPPDEGDEESGLITEDEDNG